MTGGEVRDLGSQPPYAAELRFAARPTPEEQVRFIANIERILSEGSFVATYKYALLVALVDLAIERGDDGGAALPLRIDDIAEKFAELYWRQAAPYGTVGAKASGIILHQNQGKQAAAIRLLSDLRRRAGTLTEARRSPHWRPLVAAMRTLLRTMPLWRLQKVAHDELVFLYEPGPARGWITLLPGVAGQLRERATLIRRLAQTEWLRFVLSLKQNHGVLGGASGLSEFLFGSSRIALGLKLSRPLRELQHGRCFYCRGQLQGAAAVDHFIPWSRYPRDLTHNLVLAHAGLQCEEERRARRRDAPGTLDTVRRRRGRGAHADRHGGRAARRSRDVGRGRGVELRAGRPRPCAGLAGRQAVWSPVRELAAAFCCGLRLAATFPRKRGAERPQAATSTSRIVAPFSSLSTAARYSSIAFLMLSSASASVRPCDQQPGSPGTETAKPSSDSCSAKRKIPSPVRACKQGCRRTSTFALRGWA